MRGAVYSVLATSSPPCLCGDDPAKAVGVPKASGLILRVWECAVAIAICSLVPRFGGGCTDGRIVPLIPALVGMYLTIREHYAFRECARRTHDSGSDPASAGMRQTATQMCIDAPAHAGMYRPEPSALSEDMPLAP